MCASDWHARRSGDSLRKLMSSIDILLTPRCPPSRPPQASASLALRSSMTRFTFPLNATSKSVTSKIWPCGHPRCQPSLKRI
jgi:hypothetical protein